MLELPGVAPIHLAHSWVVGGELPQLDPQSTSRLLSSIADPAVRADTAERLARGWLLHLRNELGPEFQLHRGAGCWHLSSLDSNVVEANVALVQSLRTKVLNWLGPLASSSLPPTLLIVLDAPDLYARYLRTAGVPESQIESTAGIGSLALGAFPHFVAAQLDMRLLESLLVREFTLQALSNWFIPEWLRQGIAELVLSEFTDSRKRKWVTRSWLQSFWDEVEIQSFWSGEAFLRGDESADLARQLAWLLTGHIIKTGVSLQQFASRASPADSGARAVREMLDLDLGALACALLGRSPQVSWSPRSATVV
jgi:hypothetical protein